MHEQMEMIVHQAVIIYPQTKAFAIAFAKFEETAAVVIIAKNGFAVVAVIEDVKAGFFGPEEMARFARHGWAPDK